MVFTLGQRGIRSSARLEISVATLSNSEKDVYYRIDSMKSVMGKRGGQHAVSFASKARSGTKEA